MKINYLAKRYAKALFELAQQKKCIDKILAEFNSFLSIVEDNPDLQSIINLPNVVQREKVLSAFLQQRFSELFINFIIIVLRNKRHTLIPQILDALQTEYDLSKNRIRAQAITAIPLSAKELSELRRRIANYLQADVRLENNIDPSIIGGIIIILDGQVFNASITEQFNKLKQYLIKNQK